MNMNNDPIKNSDVKIHGRRHGAGYANRHRKTFL